MHIATNVRALLRNIEQNTKTWGALVKNNKTHKNVKALFKNTVLYAYCTNKIKKHTKREGITRKPSLRPHLAPNLL